MVEEFVNELNSARLHLGNGDSWVWVEVTDRAISEHGHLWDWKIKVSAKNCSLLLEDSER